MKYALLLYDVPDAWQNVDEAEMQELYEAYVAVSRDSNAYGGAELVPGDQAKTVRLRDGEPLVTDGPFAETKEVLSGLYLVEAESEEQALEWAKRIPTVSRMGGAVEVRAIVERGDMS
jgi:hypothetical protein